MRMDVGFRWATMLMVAAFSVSGATPPLITVRNSGSTNRAGISIAIDKHGRATVESSNAAPAKIKLPYELQRQLMRDIEAVGPIDKIPVRHCMKSVSFGSSTTLTYKGVDSPDLSCPGQDDPAVIALQKDVQEVMQHALAAMPQTGRFR